MNYIFRNIILLLCSCFLLSQDSFNTNLVGHWFDVNDNYWTNNISELNDIWGYQHEDGTRYALVGGWDGTYIIDISSSPSAPELVSFIPGSTSSHRDIKTFQNYMYVGTEANYPDPVLYEEGEYYVDPQGIQVIDISDPYNPVEVNEWDGVVQSHNIMEANGYLYVIGSDELLSNDDTIESWGLDDLIILDLNVPSAPVKVGGWSGAYLHDVCIKDDILYGCGIYTDTMYAFDISDKTNPVLISELPGVPKAHACWVSDDGNTLFTGSEMIGGYIMSWDVTDLSNINYLDEWFPQGAEEWSAHNVFVVGSHLYISYYVFGLQVLDISDPSNLELVAYYDTFDEGTDTYVYNGAWGVYPFFDSENIIVSDRRTGLYIIDIIDNDMVVGDVNLDGTLDITDIVLAINFIIGVSIPTEGQFYLLDINQDEENDVLDIVLMVNAILQN